MLARGCAHPVLGPILVLVLVLLLAFLLVHVVDGGFDAAAMLGSLCLAVAAVVGPILADAFSRSPRRTLVLARGNRSPPARRRTAPVTLVAQPLSAFSPPLRR